MARCRTEAMVACIADCHIGKLTKSFNVEVAGKRIRSWTKKIIKLAHLLGDGYRFNEIVLAFLGDVNDGTEIYKTQPHHQALTNVLEQAVVCAGFFNDAIDEFLDEFGKVTLVGVGGNHGRAGKLSHEACNWDLACYRLIEEHYRSNKHVHPNFHYEMDFMQRVHVRGHPIILYHGHYIRMYQRIPWYGIITRVLRWAHSIKDGFELITMGHFHTCGFWWLDGLPILLNGTLITDDEWALVTLGMTPVPRWWLFGVSDKRIPTFQYDLLLTEE